MNDDLVCKVANFGMIRELQSEDETYEPTVVLFFLTFMSVTFFWYF